MLVFSYMDAGICKYSGILGTECRSLLQKSHMKETLFCNRDLYSIRSAKPRHNLPKAKPSCA